jgi:hypothetical protein
MLQQEGSKSFHLHTKDGNCEYGSLKRKKML